MVQGNTVGVVGGSGQAGSTRERFLHQRLGAGATREVRVAADRSERRSTGSEVVVGKRAVRNGVAVIRTVCGGTCVAVVTATRLEGASRVGAAEFLDAAFVRIAGLPINGLHAVVEAGGRLELPLAEDRPSNCDSRDGPRDRDDDGQCGARDVGRV